MRKAISDFLKDEERAPRILINTSVIIMFVGFIIAISAMYFMK